MDANEDNGWLIKLVIGIAFAALSGIASWSLKTGIDNSIAIERLTGDNRVQDQEIMGIRQSLDSMNASLNIVRQIVSDTRTLVMNKLNVQIPEK